MPNLTAADITGAGFIAFSSSTKPTDAQVNTMIADAEEEFDGDSGLTTDWTSIHDPTTADNKLKKRAILVKVKLKIISVYRSNIQYAMSASSGAGDQKSWNAQEIQEMKNRYTWIVNQVT